MDSTAAALLELDKEARMEIAIKLKEANPSLSVRGLAKTHHVPRLTLNYYWKGRRLYKEAY